MIGDALALLDRLVRAAELAVVELGRIGDELQRANDEHEGVIRDSNAIELDAERPA